MLDLNQTNGQSLFELSPSFGPGDVRSYLYWLKPVDENFKLDTSKDLELGSLDLAWRSYFGDPGQLSIGPFKAVASR